MDDAPPRRPGPEPMAPRLGRPGDPLPTRSGRQVVVVFGSMTLLFVLLVTLAVWGAKNG
jgi:hypothetical protein